MRGKLSTSTFTDFGLSFRLPAWVICLCFDTMASALARAASKI